MNSKIWLNKLTRREFRTRMNAGELKLAILPVAAIEQHLEHLAMEHDWRSARLIAGAVAERLAPQALVAEGLMAGISEHHMVHPGTLSLQPGTFLTVLSDLIDSLVRAGFTNILVLNGHGGNIAACDAVFNAAGTKAAAGNAYASCAVIISPANGCGCMAVGDQPVVRVAMRRKD